MTEPLPAWRVGAVHFHTERGARTHAAITAGPDTRADAPTVEHRDADGWHACPVGLPATITAAQGAHELAHRDRPAPITSRPPRSRRSDAVPQ